MKHLKLFETYLIDDYYSKILTNLEDEFSKYLEVKTLNKGEGKNITVKFWNELQIGGFDREWQTLSPSNKIFLVDDNYGCILVPNTMGKSIRGISIYAVYKSGINKFSYCNFGSANRQLDFFYVLGSDIQTFVKEIVEKLKKQNEIRIKNIEKRELRSAAKKYNL